MVPSLMFPVPVLWFTNVPALEPSCKLTRVPWSPAVINVLIG